MRQAQSDRQGTRRIERHVDAVDRPRCDFERDAEPGASDRLPVPVIDNINVGKRVVDLEDVPCPFDPKLSRRRLGI